VGVREYGMSYSAMVSQIVWGVLLLVVVLGFLFMGILAFSDQTDGIQQLFNRRACAPTVRFRHVRARARTHTHTPPLSLCDAYMPV
jgi:hypothetical protein